MRHASVSCEVVWRIWASSAVSMCIASVGVRDGSAAGARMGAVMEAGKETGGDRDVDAEGSGGGAEDPAGAEEANVGSMCG